MTSNISRFLPTKLANRSNSHVLLKLEFLVSSLPDLVSGSAIGVFRPLNLNFDLGDFHHELSEVFLPGIKFIHLRQAYASPFSPIFTQCSQKNCGWHPHLSATLENPQLLFNCSGGSKGVPPAPPQPKIFSISCSFLENLAKSSIRPPPWRVGAPPTGNPGSAPELYAILGAFESLGKVLSPVMR